MDKLRRVEVSADDVWGQFGWAERPVCSCGQLAQAVEDQLIFVSPELVGEGAQASNLFYLLPVSGDGFFALNEGVAIACCPWCGDPIRGRRGPA
ncbi:MULTISPECIES: hypothetical protein [unclassified Devosia]|uniref:hypothetical protein n=1 Tax=unclassified Devosia TaxID=196773 RepID=UPI0015566A4B|nr:MULTISPECIES: hypothetical protein [unclassified Devosia]